MDTFDTLGKRWSQTNRCPELVGDIVPPGQPLQDSPRFSKLRVQAWRLRSFVASIFLIRERMIFSGGTSKGVEIADKAAGIQ
jgi:hypothetical protein